MQNQEDTHKNKMQNYELKLTNSMKKIVLRHSSSIHTATRLQLTANSANEIFNYKIFLKH